MHIGSYQKQILDYHIEVRRQGWETKFRIGRYRPWTREFGSGWPIYIISSDPEEKVTMRHQISLLKFRGNATSRIEAFRKYIKEHERERRDD